MVRQTAIALYALAACAPATPAERGIVVSEDIYKVRNQDKALLLTESMVEDEYGVRFENLWQDATIYWADTRCYYNDSYAVLYEYGDGPPRCLAGITFSCNEVIVARNADLDVCGTALVHEFGHCLAINLFGHGDADHLDVDFWGLVEFIADDVCERDW